MVKNNLFAEHIPCIVFPLPLLEACGYWPFRGWKDERLLCRVLFQGRSDRTTPRSLFENHESALETSNEGTVGVHWGPHRRVLETCKTKWTKVSSQRVFDKRWVNWHVKVNTNRLCLSLEEYKLNWILISDWFDKAFELKVLSQPDRFKKSLFRTFCHYKTEMLIFNIERVPLVLNWRDNDNRLKRPKRPYNIHFKCKPNLLLMFRIWAWCKHSRFHNWIERHGNLRTKPKCALRSLFDITLRLNFRILKASCPRDPFKMQSSLFFVVAIIAWKLQAGKFLRTCEVSKMYRRVTVWLTLSDKTFPSKSNFTILSSYFSSFDFGAWRRRNSYEEC